MSLSINSLLVTGWQSYKITYIISRLRLPSPNSATASTDVSTGTSPSVCEQCHSSVQAKDGFRSIGGIPGQTGLVLTAGQPVGKGLSAQAAKELGLNAGTAVGSGAIDAYAGWIGTVAAPMPDLGINEVNLKESRHRLAAIAGTSTCHIVQSPEAVFVPGVWGPYLNAVFAGCKSAYPQNKLE